MNMRFLRSNSKNALCVEIQLLGLEKTLNFWRENISEVEMVLLQKALNDALGEQLENIRKVSYERGWRDKASHKNAKNTWFPTSLDIMDWECE